ncbi:MAG: LuxR C-terminal-related transcriptional regulator [Thermoanaerobaculia bacterium]
MGTPAALERGREAFERQAWGKAYAQLSAADREGPLEPGDLESLATAAHLVGRDGESSGVWARAHDAYVHRGDAPRGARCAFHVALPLILKGETARGGGWVSRAQRLLDDAGAECVERGYLLFIAGLRSALSGDPATAHATFTEVARTGERFGDRDLVTMARHGQGRALIKIGETARGVALLDEVMVGVTAGEVSPGFAADVYCSVLEACREMYDLRRAQEWTAALGRWTASRNDLPTYRGQCLVHRAEILQVHGAWPEAMDEAERARESLSQPPPHPAVGAAFYQLAELHRLRGDFAKAEEAYREASRHGREPQPGLAQLRLAQGRTEAAQAAIGRALDEARDRWSRSRMLGPSIEIRLAAGDVPAARAAADELEGIAASLDVPYLRAMSAHATGAVLLGEGNARSALATLRRAWAGFRDAEAPHEAARVRVLVGLACRTLGDEDSAAMELDLARKDFQKLGAAPDLARMKELSRPPASGATPALTAREVQVIVLVATGRTNRAIAEELAISQKTVARHVSNIFTKLGLSSRAAATAYAYQHGLVAART